MESQNQANRFSTGAFFLRSIKKVIKPRSKEEDLARREFILNIILAASIMLSGLSFISSLYSKITIGREYAKDGVSPLIMLAIFLVFTFLYWIARKGAFILVSALLLSVYFIAVTYTLYSWGIELTYGLLSYVVIIIFSGILVSIIFSVYVTAIVSLVIMLLTYLQVNQISHPNILWKEQMVTIPDGFVFMVILWVIMIITWLSNNQIEKSLARAERSEKALKKERDMLEVRVEQKTEQIKKIQLEKMAEMTRFAEFGRLASGIFHDLANPLTAISLALEKIDNKETNNAKNSKEYLEQAIGVSKRLEEFIAAANRQMQGQDKVEIFSVEQEISKAIQILSYQARKNQVTLDFVSDQIKIKGNPIKFHQIAVNLICNAIDSYENTSKTERDVKINISRNDNKFFLEVEDFGKGVSTESLDKIFEPFFTTKSANKGSGIGLSYTKYIIEEHFSGKISVKSKEGEGTTFIVEIPITHDF